MTEVFKVLVMTFLLNAVFGAILKHTKHTDERQLQTKLVAKNEGAAQRKLGLEDDLQREHEDEQNLNNMKLMMINMKKEGELRNLESIINDIGDRVEEINDTIRSKTNEFIDKVDSVRKSRNVSQNIIKVGKN